MVRGGYLGELNDQQRDYLRRLDRRSRTMLSLINELMTLVQNCTKKGRASASPLTRSWSPTGFQRPFQDEAAEKRVDFKLVVPEDLPPIQGGAGGTPRTERSRISLSNALKYSPLRGVRVREFRTGESDVADRGKRHGNRNSSSGNTRARLFDDFFRAEMPGCGSTRHGLGSGHCEGGMSAPEHGGRIMVESEEGFGSIFVVHFPIMRLQEAFAWSAGEALTYPLAVYRQPQE